MPKEMTESIAPKDDLIYRVPTTLQNPHFGDPGAFDQRRPWNQYVMGYPRFAAFISSDEDRSTTIYRRFERLSARNLLYLETELQELEETQDRLDASSRLDQNLASSMQSLEELNMLSKLGLDPQKKGLAAIPEIEARQPQSQGRQRIGDDRDYFLSESAQARLHVAARIRVVLREYCRSANLLHTMNANRYITDEFLKLESEILALNNPDKRTLKGVRKVFNNVLEEEAHAPMVSGAMETHLDEKNENDLHVANVLLLRKTNTGRCVLAPPVVRDRLTRLLEGRLAFLFRVSIICKPPWHQN